LVRRVREVRRVLASLGVYPLDAQCDGARARSAFRFASGIEEMRKVGRQNRPILPKLRWAESAASRKLSRNLKSREADPVDVIEITFLWSSRASCHALKS
jgi:hypothetical protein